MSSRSPRRSGKRGGAPPKPPPSLSSSDDDDSDDDFLAPQRQRAVPPEEVSNLGPQSDYSYLQNDPTVEHIRVTSVIEGRLDHEVWEQNP